ncbi:MAG: hypothetical protein OXF88_23570 [Rhodobacteraceae bacterium]|nr:hypothetical protein [Paracoccaceae bacterium]MCY4141753.1 hypothetical protein [Paracoccaceae bacterium]
MWCFSIACGNSRAAVRSIAPQRFGAPQNWTALHALAEGGAGPGAAESGQPLLRSGIDPKAGDHKRRIAWDLVRARFKPEQLADLAAENPEVGWTIVRLKAAVRG